MAFLTILVASAVATVILRGPIKRWPVAFYGLAVVADVAYIVGIEGLLPRAVMGPLTLLMGKCVLSLALFVVVMYVGVFAKGSRAHQWLKPVRSELSIAACILACGHMAVYLASYVPRFGGALSANVLGALAVALGLLALLLVLGATSFGFVKKHMRTESWKRLQRWAYAFFGLVYVHLMLMLAPAAGGRRRGRGGKRGGVLGGIRRLRRAARSSRAPRPALCRRCVGKRLFRSCYFRARN